MRLSRIIWLVAEKFVQPADGMKKRLKGHLVAGLMFYIMKKKISSVIVIVHGPLTRHAAVHPCAMIRITFFSSAI